jgi:transcriptional regulator with XRE-family HTH domain
MPRGGWKLDGRRVQKERLARGWTVEHLAQKAGISDRRLRTFEKDDEGVAMQSTILCLAKCFDLPVTDLASPPTPVARSQKKTVAATPREPPAPPPVIGPLHEPTQLERLVAIESTTPTRPQLVTPDGLVEPLTAKRMQDIFTAYALRAGSRFYATGRVVTHRGLKAPECGFFGAKAGVASRVFLFVPISGENGLSLTVHARQPEHTLFLQEKKDQLATVVVRVVLAPEEAVQAGAGFTFFQSKTPREWALVVEDARDPEVTTKPAGPARRSAGRPSRTA